MIGANKSVSKEEEKRKCDVKRSSRIQLCNATTMAAKKNEKNPDTAKNFGFIAIPL